MADREKVIKGLGCIAGVYDMENNKCAGCGYRDCATYAICIGEIARDAIELLKVQESFQPFRSGDYHPDWCCGNCKYPGLYGRMKFCPECGKAVKWDEET